MLGNLGIGYFLAQRHQGCMSALLVGTHKPVVARDIGRENGCEPSLDPTWAERASRTPRVLRSSRSLADDDFAPRTISNQQLTARRLRS